LVLRENAYGCIPEKRYSPRWWRHPKDENVSLRAKRSNLFDRDCFVACAPRNDIPSSLMRCHCCSFDRLPLFWNAPNSFVLHFFKPLNSYRFCCFSGQAKLIEPEMSFLQNSIRRMEAGFFWISPAQLLSFPEMCCSLGWILINYLPIETSIHTIFPLMDLRIAAGSAGSPDSVATGSGRSA